MVRTFFKIGSAILVCVFFGNVALAGAVTEARKALVDWQLISVEKRKSSLIVVMKERRVNSATYNLMITMICLWTAGVDRKRRIKLFGVKEIAILNRFRAAGRVFEYSTKKCERIVNAPGSKVDVLIAGQTHMYACTSGRGCKY